MMKFPFRLLSAYGFALLAAAAFGWLALQVGRGTISAFDSRIIAIVQGWENPGLTRIMMFFSWIGKTGPATLVFVILAFVLFFVLRHRKELILLTAAAGGAPLLNRVLKAAFQRERPNIHRIVEEVGYSFPSGHAMASFAMYGAIGYLLWRHVPSLAGRILLIAVCSFMIIMIGLSRIYLGVHYPSDVLGGYLASWVWLGLVIWLYERWVGKPVKA
ncbi:phosphatase PAP2 family protein [Cohnella pontilimi]|uniref:Phosphatase PAP2 family protein n=1 Tax=Cohnella pontilimi TaxID=2564100 RepID=A0A4U0F8K3_9BACL|nr:phosphatase PAP2 family protein [Cohnella pontilimi]TJY40961.1 phosphatase PAP2 family protein [Cohnella pontilimi]